MRRITSCLARRHHRAAAGIDAWSEVPFLLSPRRFARDTDSGIEAAALGSLLKDCTGLSFCSNSRSTDQLAHPIMVTRVSEIPVVSSEVALTRRKLYAAHLC